MKLKFAQRASLILREMVLNTGLQLKQIQPTIKG